MTCTENEQRFTEVLLEVFHQKGLTPPELGPGTVLDGLRLESLDFAQAVIRMEEVTGKDPFAGGADYEIKTLADIAALYD